MKEFRANAPTPSMSEMGKALSGRVSVPNELRFAYWQKWAWETADIPVAMIIAGTMRDAPLSPRELAAYDAPFLENVRGRPGNRTAQSRAAATS